MGKPATRSYCLGPAVPARDPVPAQGSSTWQRGASAGGIGWAVSVMACAHSRISAFTPPAQLDGGGSSWRGRGGPPPPPPPSPPPPPPAAPRRPPSSLTPPARMDLPKLPPGKRFTLPRPSGAADALLLARLGEREKAAGRVTAIVTADATDAQRLIDEMAFFAPEL